MSIFKELKVWDKSHKLAIAVYEATRPFPQEEMYGLTSELRRSAVSVPSNIAEGCGRGTDREMARSLRLALGSANELEYQLLLARDLGFLGKLEHVTLTDLTLEIQRMLAAFARKLASDEGGLEPGSIVREERLAYDG